MYHNLLLRDAVFNVVADEATNGGSRSGPWLTVVQALQRAFAHMKGSRHGLYDLRTFVGELSSDATCCLHYLTCACADLLGLNSGEQQDPQEFSKLLLSGVEALALSRRSTAHSSLSD